MKKIFQLTSILAVLSLLVLSCTKKELSTDQFDSTRIVLQAYGPQPVVRGGVLRFVGSNLDQVKTVAIPGVGDMVPEVITAGTHSEIRVTVPKDGPEPGYPVLTLPDGTTITGKTPISYSEPISITSFAPAEVLPGQSITIDGDYLNLIHEIIYANKIILSEKQFTTHTRYKIVVAVPETAQTGKFGLGTVDETVAEDENLLASLNIVESATDLVVTTAKGTLAANTYKAGETITINGTNMSLVKGLLLEGATMGPDEFTATATKLTFPLYASVSDGDVIMVMASGVEVSAGAITTVVPTELTVAPAPVKNGADLTITGKDLDLVTGLDFPHSTGAEFAFADDKITVTVTEKAQEGDITLSLANGKSVSVAFTLVKPTVTAFSANPAAAGSPVTITGTDLDLVESVTFGLVKDADGNVTAEGVPADPDEITETSITVSVPTAAEAGIFVLNLINGTTIETKELAVDKPAGAYIPVMPDILYSPGDMFIVTIENADHLTGVQVDGVDVNYILNASDLYFSIPEDAKANSQLTLVSDNGSVTYTMNIDPGDFIVTPIWNGSFVGDSWSVGCQDLAWGNYDWSTVEPGLILRLTVESIFEAGEWWCVQPRHGDSWGKLPESVPAQFDSPEGTVEFVLTKEVLADLVEHNGLVVTGYGYKLTQIALVKDLRYGDTLWEGEFLGDSWSVGNQSLAWGGYDWSQVKAGQTLFVHVTSIVEEGEWWCVQLRHGDSWGKLPDAVPAQYDTPENPIAVKLTQEVIDDLVAHNGLVVTGYGYKNTKISLK